jgi:hypothetical protein
MKWRPATACEEMKMMAIGFDRWNNYGNMG